MDIQLTTKDFLRVFEHIISKGENKGDKHQLGELSAWQDFDGYTCWLSYRDVTVTLMFHGKLKVDYEKMDNYDDLLMRCRRIIREK